MYEFHKSISLQETGVVGIASFKSNLLFIPVQNSKLTFIQPNLLVLASVKITDLITHSIEPNTYRSYNPIMIMI